MEDRIRTQNDLREHMKQFHFQVVSKCKNGDECKFRHRKCWFIHQEEIEIEYNNAKNGIKINDKNCDMELNLETNQEIWNWQNSNIKKNLVRKTLYRLFLYDIWSSKFYKKKTWDHKNIKCINENSR